MQLPAIRKSFFQVCPVIQYPKRPSGQLNTHLKSKFSDCSFLCGNVSYLLAGKVHKFPERFPKRPIENRKENEILNGTKTRFLCVNEKLIDVVSLQPDISGQQIGDNARFLCAAIRGSSTLHQAIASDARQHSPRITPERRNDQRNQKPAGFKQTGDPERNRHITIAD